MTAPEDRTVPSNETRAEEEREAHAPHGDAAGSDNGDAGEAPTSVDEDVKEHYREMTERGANQRGEGRIE